MTLISKKELTKLLRQAKHSLGFPVRPIELDDPMMETFLEMSIEDYSSIVNQWLVEQQWVGLQGVEIEGTDFASIYNTKSNDFMKSFTFAYSKQVGLGTNAPAAVGWELKRDFIVTSANTQHYIIPAGREVNEVLWETPPSIDQGLVDPFALSNWQSGQFGWSYLGRPAQYVQPTYSLLLSAQDRRMKERILQSELTYRITGMEDGRKLLYLYPIPGSRHEISNHDGKHFSGRKIWYFYYDLKDIDRDKCLEDNEDVVRLPSDAPIDFLKYDSLNSTARQQVRDIFIGYVKLNVGNIRGFFSGTVGAANKELQMDYRHLLEEGALLKEKTETKIQESLDKISLRQLAEDRANIAENVNRERGFQPFKFPIMIN